MNDRTKECVLAKMGYRQKFLSQNISKVTSFTLSLFLFFYTCLELFILVTADNVHMSTINQPIH